MPPQNDCPTDLNADPNKKKEPRVGRACDACRRAKVRCLDGSTESPCARCRATGSSCTFESKSTKRGPPRGYVESLERRLEAMEALLSALSATTQDPEAERQYKRLLEEDGLLSQSSSPHEAMSSPLDISAVDALTGDMEELSVDKDRYVGRGSGLHLAQSIRQYSKPHELAMNLPEDDCPSVVEHLLMEDQRHKSHGFQLPPPDLSTKLVSAYFTKFNDPECPLLHRPSFDRAMKDGSLDRDPSFRSLFFMVCAIGARFVDDPRVDIKYSEDDVVGSRQSRGFEFFQACSGSASPSLMTATLYDIQCSVLAITWLMGSATPISAWAAVGFAIRRVIDTGAHRENRSRWNASPLEDQLRRRAFYLLFGWDRMLSAALGRPLAIHEEDIDLVEAIDIDDAALDAWNLRGPKSPPPPTTTPGPLAAQQCLRRLFTIVGRALRLLYGMNRQNSNVQRATEAVCELDSLLNEWLNLIPDHLKWDPDNQDPKYFSQSVLIYTTYYSTQILCHRDFISPSRCHLHSFPSLAICSNAARSCSHVLDLARKRGLLEAGFWHIPLSAATAGLILLINVFAKGSPGTSLTSSAMGDVKKCIAVVQSLSESTHLAMKCTLGLGQLATLAATTQPRPASAAAPSLKRPLDTDAVPSPTATASGESSIESPSGSTGADVDASDVSGAAYRNKNSRRKTESNLPMTTDDLSLLTFNGRPTFSTRDPPNALPTQQPSAPFASMGLPLPPTTTFLDGGMLSSGPFFGTSPSFTSQPSEVNWNSQSLMQPTPALADFGYSNTDPYSQPASSQPSYQGTGEFTSSGFNDAFSLPYQASTPSNFGGTEFDNFNWSALGLTSESQLTWDNLLPAMTGHGPIGTSSSLNGMTPLPSGQPVERT